MRDLPAKDGSVDPDNDFHMLWELDGRGAKQIAEIARAAKGAEKLILATDPIARARRSPWHIQEALNQKRALKDVRMERVTFNAITKDAVQKALAEPRQVDQALVDAYLARRALDYLVGFRLSPVLWRKLPGAKSAGRVQSVALKLVADRGEREIEAFRAREYWSVVARLATPDRAEFEARLVGGRWQEDRPAPMSAPRPKPRPSAMRWRRPASKVASVEAKPAKRHPAPPFMTSTLQQEASRKLGFSPAPHDAGRPAPL